MSPLPVRRSQDLRSFCSDRRPCSRAWGDWPASDAAIAIDSSFDQDEGTGATQASTVQALAELERGANELALLRSDHRRTTLGAVAGGGGAADEAFARVDAVRRLATLAHHAWRAAAHLVDRGG